MAPHARFANLPEVLVHYRRGPQNIGHGRDKVADFVILQRAALKAFGISFTEEELDLQLMGGFLFRVKPTPAHIRALRKWFDGLLQLNATTRFAPPEALAAIVEAQWTKLFHFLPLYGLAVALVHLRLDHNRSMANLIYALKYRVNARLGKLPNG